MDLSRWAPSIDPYAKWIEKQHFDAAKNWAGRLRAGAESQVEAAVAEAIAWDWLANRVDSIALGSPPGVIGPDLRCVVRGEVFFVEVTNIAREVMTAVTGMPDTELFKGNHGCPADRLHREITGKAVQGAGLDAPYLVFPTTLHWNASSLLTHRGHLEAVLHSRTYLAGEFDTERGEILEPLREETDLKRAAFTATGSATPLRTHVSGALFGPFGLYPGGIDVHGILNPVADHPFDPGLLPDVPFCRFRTWPPDHRIQVEWTDQLDRKDTSGPDA